jgi:hypothetical protein
LTETVAERFRDSEIAALLVRYPGLRLVPSASMGLRVEGMLRFCANGKKTEVIEDGYDVRIEAPENFPQRMALAWETGGRIPPDYHKLTNGALCLGSRVRLRLQMGESPSLLRFVERCVIPYLYGYSYSVKHGAPPFGELAHGELGSLQDLAGLLGVEDLTRAFRYCTLAAAKRRRANKRPCPCGSGRQLGRCHSRRVNALRKRVGRTVLASEMKTIALAFREQSRRKRVATLRQEAAAAKPSLLEMIREIRRPAMLPTSPLASPKWADGTRWQVPHLEPFTLRTSPGYL